MRGQIYGLIEKSYPIYRSKKGEGVKKPLEVFKLAIHLEVHEIPAGTKTFDWAIPTKWSINEAWLKDLDGDKTVGFWNSKSQV